MAEPADDPNLTARTLVTWTGAALLLCGAGVLAALLWRESDEPVRLVLLLTGTLVSMLLARLAHHRAPATGEALVVVSIGLLSLDWMVAGRTGLRPEVVAPSTWWSAGACAIAVAALLVGRLTKSIASRIAGVVLAVAAVPGAMLLLDPAHVVGGAALVAAATTLFALGATRTRLPEVRAALAGVAATGWLIEVATVSYDVLGGVLTDRVTPWIMSSEQAVSPALAASGIAALLLVPAPLVLHGRSIATNAASGVAASLPAALSLVAGTLAVRGPWPRMLLVTATVLVAAGLLRVALDRPGGTLRTLIASAVAAPASWAALVVAAVPIGRIAVAHGSTALLDAAILLAVAAAVPTAIVAVLGHHVSRAAAIVTGSVTGSLLLGSVTLTISAAGFHEYTTAVIALLAVALVALPLSDSAASWSARATAAVALGAGAASGALVLALRLVLPSAVIPGLIAVSQELDLTDALAPQWEPAIVSAAIVLAAASLVVLLVRRQPARHWAPLPAPARWLPTSAVVALTALTAAALVVAAGAPRAALMLLTVLTALGALLVPPALGLPRSIPSALATAVALVAAAQWLPSSPWVAAVTLATAAVAGPWLAGRTPDRTDRIGLWAIATLAAPFALPSVWRGLGFAAPVEAYLLPLAVLLGYAALRESDGLRALHGQPSSSWLAEAPPLMLALGPSLVAGIGGDHSAIRLGAVVVAASLVLLIGARHRRQGPVVVALAALAAVVTSTVGPRLGELPPWSALVVSGALLLWVGFTWERRRSQLRHATLEFGRWT